MLGIVFVLLVCFLRRGIVGGIDDLYRLRGRRGTKTAEPPDGAPIAVGDRGVPKSSQRRARAGRRAMPRAPRTDGYTGPILQATGLTKRYGGVVANSDIDFTVNHGEMRGIIGPNGAGKTHLLQDADLRGAADLRHDRVRGPRHHRPERHRCLPARPDQELPDQPAVHAADGAREPDDRRARRTARQVPARPVPQPDEHSGPRPSRSSTRSRSSTSTGRADTPVSELAYGEKRRLEIGLALATSPSLLLLDEPLAGMSPRERVETVELLKSISQGRTMIVIDHDMDALFELVERVTVLQEGRVLVEGTPDEIKGNAKVQEAYLGGVHG